jgi:hypothetical protein
LTDEQVAEIRRRRTNPNPKYISLAEARRHLIIPANETGLR